MSRHYTVCAFTDSTGNQYNRRYRYRQAPPAFLFHDTEESLDVTDILKPLFRLTKFYEPDNQALVIQVDEQTLAATFSLRGLPYPTREFDWQRKPMGEVYPADDELQGWAIRNTRSLSLEPVPLNFGEIYDDCIQLPRHADLCPCNLIESGECYTSNLQSVLPKEFDTSALARAHTELDRATFKRAEFIDLAGFGYVTPGLTTETDFADAVRPWDGIDFKAIDGRKATFKARGQKRRSANAFRKEHCVKCEFAHTKYVKDKQQPTDCGSLHICKGHTKPDQLSAALAKFYDRSGFNNIAGFTAAQRDHLIGLGGQEVKARHIFSDARRTAVRFGYFEHRANSQSWSFMMSAAAGDLSRRKRFDSYSELREVLPDLPVKPTDKRTYREKLACVIFGIHRYQSGGWGSTYDRAHVTIQHDGVYSEFSNSRYGTGGQTLDFSHYQYYWAHLAFNYQFSRIPEYLDSEGDVVHLDPFL